MENVVISASPLAFTIKTLCKAVGISVRHYYTLREKGLGPEETHLGGRILIRTDTARAWLAEREGRHAA